MTEFPRETARYSYFSIPIIDVYYKTGSSEKGNNLLAQMIDDYLIEYSYLSEFNDNSGTKQNLNICMQVLQSLSRIVQINKLQEINSDFIKKNDKFYKITDAIEEEVPYSVYRINTFMDEFKNLQAI